MWYLYTNNKEILNRNIEKPKDGELADYEYVQYCYLRMNMRELIAIFMQKDDMENYIQAHPLEPSREYEIFGNKFYCDKEKIDCEYCASHYCNLKSCIHRTMDGAKAFAQYLKENTTTFNIGAEQIDSMLKMFAERFIERNTKDKHYQDNVEETRIALEQQISDTIWSNQNDNA